MLVPVILAGGSGTRLWPLSREAHPKQFIHLLEEHSLFQHTLKRVSGLGGAMPIVVGNEQHRFLIAEQLRLVNQSASILLEPAVRGTAPALALAAMQALDTYNEDVLLLALPADHMVETVSGFASTVESALSIARDGKLVTFGIKPTHAETGYGYIERGKTTFEQGFGISRFVEKPTLTLAKEYVESGRYWWNSGMFLFSAGTFLQELMLHAPEIYHCVKRAFEKAQYETDFIRPDRAEFEQSPTDSIDYAVMENTLNGVVFPLQSRWDDVGAWDALTTLYTPDEKGNVSLGQVYEEETKNCFVRADKRLVVTVGVKDLVVIETGDAVLVLDKQHAQSLKSVVNKMKVHNRKEVTHPPRVTRPWGAFESIDEGERFQVKRITVAIGEKLSLQRHHHRSEHWVVVKGTAKVTRGEEHFLLSENQSTYIPIGVDHRLENVGKIPLEIIEVQSGAYLGEDDIIRLEDQYGRLKKAPSKEKHDIPQSV